MILLSREQKTLTINGDKVKLSPLEWRALVALADNHGTVTSKDALASAMYGDQAFNIGVADAMIEKVVGRLRQKLRAYGAENNIETRRGFGYVFRYDGDLLDEMPPIVGDITEIALAMSDAVRVTALAVMKALLEQQNGVRK